MVQKKCHPGKGVGVGALCLLLGACGGGGGSSGTGTTTPSGSISGPSTGPFSVQSCTTPSAWGSSTASSQWVFPSNGYLAYKPLDVHGDIIMDYSSAGYMGGGVAFPAPAATVTVRPLGGGQDDTANIQAAINQVAALSPGNGGLRGVVLLAPGTFLVGNTLTIAASGVILRGSGSGAGGTVINDVSPLQNGTTPASPGPGTETGQTLLKVAGGAASAGSTSFSSLVADTYVPAGAPTLTLNDASGFHVGDSVLVQRPVTNAWVSFMGMANLGPGKSWLDVGSSIDTPRTIVAISGNKITLDVPLSDSFDGSLLNPPGAKVSLNANPGYIQQVGIEHLRMVGVPRTLYTSNNMLVMDGVADGWVDDVVGDNFTAGLNIRGHSKRVTVRGLQLTHENNGADVPCTGAKFAEISVAGTQILVDRSASTGSAASFYYATESRTVGPNVLLNFKGVPDNVCGSANIQPHQRWATGLLIDGAQLAPNPVSQSASSIDLSNRGTDGSGQGWAIGWGVVWNSTATFNIQAPPGAMNWLIGSTGNVATQTAEPPGIVDAPNQLVAPKSLYLAQLCQRNGPSALTSIGY